MTKKFSELDTITTPDDADLLAVHDVDVPETKAITIADLRAAVGSSGDLQDAYDGGETIQITTGTPVVIEDLSGAGSLVQLNDVNGGGMALTAAGLRGDSQLVHQPTAPAVVGDAGLNHSLLGGDGAVGDGGTPSGDGADVVIDAGAPGADGGAGEGTPGDVSIGETTAATIRSGSGLTVWEHDGTIEATGAIFGDLLATEEKPGAPLATAGRAKIYASSADNRLSVMLSTSDAWLLAGASGVTPSAPSLAGAEGGNLSHARSDHAHPFERPTVVFNTTDTTDTLADADHNSLIAVQHASGMTVTVPSGLTAGTTVKYLQAQGTGQVIVAAGGGMTLIYPPTFLPRTNEENSAVTITILSSALALIEGDLEAA